MDSAAEGAAPGKATMMSEEEEVEERFAALIGIPEECVTADELRPLLRGKPHPVCYDGFDPSGRMHIAQDIYEHGRTSLDYESGALHPSDVKLALKEAINQILMGYSKVETEPGSLGLKQLTD